MTSPPPDLLLDPAAHPVIGHRGAASYAPENTLESFRLALSLGAEALEFDVRRSADGVAMVCHDPTIDRTTDRTGAVAWLTRAELQAADAGCRFVDADGATPWAGRGVQIPTLAAVLAEFREVPLLIEIKEPEVQEVVAAELVAAGAAGRAVLAGDDWQALAAFRAAPFRLGASRRDISGLFFGFRAPDPACRLFAVPHRFHGLTVPSRRFCRAARRHGATTHVWTVDDARSAIRLWRNGAQGIVTNRPDAIRAARDAFVAGRV